MELIQDDLKHSLEFKPEHELQGNMVQKRIK